ncbi:urea ABC transporter permease subunit UrtB [Rhizobium sp. L1K21]|uniref:urea ABC transporter permease subunit UrtB n=1 Tax=Rhizobium sp. L1K21 TaxID=2954933 RepID=UPI0020939B44|nr:urea ABC transporter permease subunit UrtB [Rhizobium sp. L1K21]MCO6185312.1 urea ABC transporter permease subunit UrtB [Rhizobium sp. L1K21]
MLKAIQLFLVAVSLAVAFVATDLRAQDATPEMINELALGSYDQTEETIKKLAATGDTAIVPALEALSEGDLYVRKADGQVFIVKKSGKNYKLTDPLSGEVAGEEPTRNFEKIKVKNSLRRQIRSVVGGLTLQAKDASTRLAAANTIIKTPDEDAIDALNAAIEKEQNANVLAALEQARAASIIISSRAPEEKVEAITRIKNMGGREALSLLLGFQGQADESLKPQIDAAIESINSDLAMWDAAQNIWYGISLGSVLLLAAIGLAITFGVMGIINMAHGEMVMLGAYSTYVVQEIIRNSAPHLFDWSLAIALPIAFVVSGAVGLVIERLVIRFLYGRPLETLLATWGISLILQQAVRTIFGPTNKEVGNPSWMSGAFELGGLTITWNRMWIVVFTIGVFFALLALLKRSPIGLQMRAVTQNRRMASSMGIRTPWVDAATFALGSGIAGIAGVALSQIDNVSPNLGQGYIIDSFMVVVFGGVGNLWGTLVGALSLGVLNKFLEPYAGAVLGKIIVLVLIILFIQKRPRGLFALKGRAVES